MADESTGGSHSPQPEQTGRPPEVITTPEGFKIHGKNETSLIRSLESLNGTPIAQLEDRMRPGGMLAALQGRRTGGISDAGFLGIDESLTEVLADDNETVEGMGLTHQQVADFLHKFDNAPGEGELGQYGTIEVDGEKFAHAATRWRGIQQSPFGDGTGTNSDHTIINLETGAGIDYSGLLPEMIHRYGFYEGKGTGYRLDPKRVAEVAGFTPPPPDDPVVQLVQNRAAHVEITTREQLARVSNLDSTKVDVLSGQNYRIVPEDLDALLGLSTAFARSPYSRGQEEPEAQKARREQIAAHVDTQRLTPQPYQLGRYDYTILTEVIPSDFPQFEQTVLGNIEQLQLMRGDSVDQYAVKGFIEAALKGASQKVDGQDSPHKGYYEGILKKLPKDPQTSLQIYDAAASLYKQPTEVMSQKAGGETTRQLIQQDNTEALALIATLDSTLPSLRSDVIGMYKQLGMPVSDDMTLEQLIKEKGNMEQYQKTLKESTRFVRDIGGVKDAQTQDIGTLMSIITAVQRDPNHEFTPDEQQTMERLHADPALIPYAFKVNYGGGPDSYIAQLYNGAAKKEQELDQTFARLPDNIDEQARAAIQQLIKFQQRAYSGKIDVGEFIGRITTKAEDLKSKGEGQGQQSLVTESDVLNDYVGLVVPQFSELLSHPLFRKNLPKETYSSQAVEVSLNPTILESLPEVEVQDAIYGTKKYRKLTIGDQTYTIDKYGIAKGEPKHGAEKLSIESGNKIRLSATVV